jgi:predicted negative regulator of RcsB-dependent stress response
MFEGDMIYPLGKFDEAAAAYDKAIESAPDALRPYATADKVMTLEAAGKFADCATVAQAFLEAQADHLLAAQVHTVLARCQVALGQSEAALSTLQRISLQYRDTPWAQWANERLQTLTKK